ncbi:sulfide-dependent adenosine diphosphate thiazole synthase [Stetteria hydrogenophila]
MAELEARITRAIVEEAARDWSEIAESDVVIVGAGPSGLTAARYLAEAGFRVVVFERRLSFGGGIGGGGNLFHRIVVAEEALGILRDFNIRYRSVAGGLYTVDPAEFMAKLAAGAIDAGARIIHGVNVEDVIVRFNPVRVAGVAVNWSAIPLAGLHVDPIFVYSRAVVDATGHDAYVLRVVARKIPDSGVKVPGESSAYSEEAERLVVEKTGRVIPGLYAAGMAVAALHGLPRMGPIFTSMLLSGRRAAEAVARDLEGGQ